MKLGPHTLSRHGTPVLTLGGGRYRVATNLNGQRRVVKQPFPEYDRIEVDGGGAVFLGEDAAVIMTLYRSGEEFRAEIPGLDVTAGPSNPDATLVVSRCVIVDPPKLALITSPRGDRYATHAFTLTVLEY